MVILMQDLSSHVVVIKLEVESARIIAVIFDVDGRLHVCTIEHRDLSQVCGRESSVMLEAEVGGTTITQVSETVILASEVPNDFTI